MTIRRAVCRSLLLAAGPCLWSTATAHAASAPLDTPAAINAALAKGAPGDTVVVSNGVYRDAHITLAAGGQEGKPVTLAAETPGRVTFTGRSRITLAGKHQHVTGLVFQKNLAGTAVEFAAGAAQHCRLSHTAFNESGAAQSTFTHMVEVGENCTDNQIDHCYLAKSLSMSIGTRYGAARCRIDHNWFRDIVARSSNGQEALQLQGYRLDKEQGNRPIREPDGHRLFCTVEHNLFDGACGDEEIISVKSNDNIIRYNTFLKHPTANKGGVVIRQGDRNLVDSNWFLGTQYGVRVSGAANRITNNYIEHGTYGILMTAGGPDGWAYAVATDCLVANNTIAEAKNKALCLGTYYGLTKPEVPGKVVDILPTGNKIYNNLLTSGSPEVVALQGDGRFADNDFRANLIACSKPKGGDLPQAPGLIAAEPPLLAKQGDRFVPRDAALAAGRGVPVEGLKEDVAGRPRKPKPDIGCEELDAGPPARQPLTSKDVGPDWMNGDYTTLEKSAALDELRDLVRRYPEAEFRRQLRAVLEEASPQ